MKEPQVSFLDEVLKSKAAIHELLRNVNYQSIIRFNKKILAIGAARARMPGTSGFLIGFQNWNLADVLQPCPDRIFAVPISSDYFKSPRVMPDSVVLGNAIPRFWERNGQGLR